MCEKSFSLPGSRKLIESANDIVQPVRSCLLRIRYTCSLSTVTILTSLGMSKYRNQVPQPVWRSRLRRGGELRPDRTRRREIVARESFAEFMPKEGLTRQGGYQSPSFYAQASVGAWPPARRACDARPDRLPQTA